MLELLFPALGIKKSAAFICVLPEINPNLTFNTFENMDVICNYYRLF